MRWFVVSLFVGTEIFQTNPAGQLLRSLLLWFCHQLSRLIVHWPCAWHFYFSFVWNIWISFDWIDKFRVFSSMKNHWCFRVPLCLSSNYMGRFWWIGFNQQKYLKQPPVDTSWYLFPPLWLLLFGYLCECGRSLVRLLRLFLEEWKMFFFNFKFSKTFEASFSFFDVSCNSMFRIHGVNNIISLPQRRKWINGPTASKIKSFLFVSGGFSFTVQMLLNLSRSVRNESSKSSLWGDELQVTSGCSFQSRNDTSSPPFARNWCKSDLHLNKVEHSPSFYSLKLQ